MGGDAMRRWLCEPCRELLGIREILTLGHDGTNPCVCCEAKPTELVSEQLYQEGIRKHGERAFPFAAAAPPRD